MDTEVNTKYSKCLKITNSSCLRQKPRQIGKTQITLLLKIGPSLFSFLTSISLVQATFYLKTEREKFSNFRTFTVDDSGVRKG